MKLKPLALAAAVAIGIAGLANAGSKYFVEPDPQTMLSLASEQLTLTPAQEDKLRPLLQQAAALRVEIKSQATAMRAATRDELNRSDADLRALSSERQALIAKELTAVDSLRNRFLAFYEGDLSPGQQLRARQMLLKRLDRFDQMRERMMAITDRTYSAP
jgi:hypothetical protein